MKVELQPAYFWKCPNCDADNIAHLVMMEMTAEQREEIEEHTGAINIKTGDCFVGPCEVTCKKCESDFETTQP